MIPSTVSDSFIIDLSNDVFFHIFYRQLTNISEIETAVIGPNTGAGARQKTNKNYSNTPRL